jgi:hypothetical protein
MSDLEKVIPTPRAVTVKYDGKDEVVFVEQIKVGQLPKVLECTYQLMPAFEGKGGFDPKVLFLRHTDDVLELVALCIKKPRAWVDELEIPDGVNLFTAVLEVNLDFFVQTVLPALMDATAAISGAISGKSTLGPSPSKNSSPKDIATTTS